MPKLHTTVVNWEVNIFLIGGCELFPSASHRDDYMKVLYEEYPLWLEFWQAISHQEASCGHQEYGTTLTIGWHSTFWEKICNYPCKFWSRRNNARWILYVDAEDNPTYFLANIVNCINPLSHNLFRLGETYYVYIRAKPGLWKL